MSDLYNRIDQLCKENGVNITIMCKESGASRGSLTDLKSGRKQTLSSKTLQKIADYFSVSVDYLLGNVSDPFFHLDNDRILREINSYENENAPTETGERTISDAELKFALWGDATEIDDDDLEDVRRYAAFVKERKKAKK